MPVRSASRAVTGWRARQDASGFPRLGRRFAAVRLALEVSYAGFTRIVADDREQDVISKVALLGQPRRCELTSDEIALADEKLFILARHLNNFHPIAYGRRNVDHIGGADEKHLREVERERRDSCRGTSHFARDRELPARLRRDRHEIPRRACPLRPASSLDYGARLVNGLDDVPGQRANIGSPVPAYLAFVV